MAKILWAPGIEEVSGALTKINQKSNHANDQNMFLGTHRKAGTVQDCSRAYYRKRNQLPWSQAGAISAETEAIRMRFTEVQNAVKLRFKDLNKMTADQQAFRDIYEETKSKAGVAPTMRIFLWCVCGNEYDRAHSEEKYAGEYPTASFLASVIRSARG